MAEGKAKIDSKKEGVEEVELGFYISLLAFKMGKTIGQGMQVASTT